MLPPETPLVLWSHLSPKHVAMLPLQHASVQAAWTTIVFESFYQLRSYFETFGLRPEQVAYRWPAIVRSLRKRFTNTEQLAAARAPQPTMAFTAEPAHGLAQALELHEALKAENPGLRLRVMLKPGFEAAEAPAPVREVLARCCRNLAAHYAAAGETQRARMFEGFVDEFDSAYERNAA